MLHRAFVHFVCPHNLFRLFDSKRIEKFLMNLKGIGIVPNKNQKVMLCLHSTLTKYANRVTRLTINCSRQVIIFYYIRLIILQISNDDV